MERKSGVISEPEKTYALQETARDKEESHWEWELELKKT